MMDVAIAHIVRHCNQCDDDLGVAVYSAGIMWFISTGALRYFNILFVCLSVCVVRHVSILF